MNEQANAVRKTVYLDADLVKQSEILFADAGVDNFSRYVTAALEYYKDRLICENHSPFITAELSQTIRDEVRPIASRLSKGLYRYAIEIDMLCQILAGVSELSENEIEQIRKHANKRSAVMRGKIDLKSLLDDDWVYKDEENAYE